MNEKVGRGYYKMLDPKYKYPKCFCTDEDITMAVTIREFVNKALMPIRPDFEGGWHRDEKLGVETLHKYYKECVKLGLTASNLPEKFVDVFSSTKA